MPRVRKVFQLSRQLGLASPLAQTKECIQFRFRVFGCFFRRINVSCNFRFRCIDGFLQLVDLILRLGVVPLQVVLDLQKAFFVAFLLLLKFRKLPGLRFLQPLLQ